jgi:hypothetical protein
MSLDARIRQLAREEATKTSGGGGGCEDLAQQLVELRQEFTVLHEHQHVPMKRLGELAEQLAAMLKRVEALEAAAGGGQPNGQEPAPKRATRRRSET